PISSGRFSDLSHSIGAQTRRHDPHSKGRFSSTSTSVTCSLAADFVCIFSFTPLLDPVHPSTFLSCCAPRNISKSVFAALRRMLLHQLPGPAALSLAAGPGRRVVTPGVRLRVEDRVLVVIFVPLGDVVEGVDRPVE